ncbi:hypothetical protein AB1Y20_009604 [Prymnesium parvum]|uniref:Uncharacterized protein n=1 Tax=Prymnesium parvum TaxID=97485 RepID=A0AB34K1Z0_PRYPA
MRASLQVSRPYFWLVTVWLYLLPTGQHLALLRSPTFWLGLVYCTYPLNLLVYLMNDLSDVHVDQHNPRKGGAGTGAKASYHTLRALVPWAVAVQLPFLLYFLVRWGAIAAPWLLGVIFVNWLYNYGPRLSSNYPPLDLFCPCGYILVVPLSVGLNGVPVPPLRAWVHVLFLVVRTQLWLETFDLNTDRMAGRRTTAVVLGMGKAQAMLAVVLAAELVFVLVCFSDWALQSFSAASLLLVALQVRFASSRDGGNGLSAEAMSRTFLIMGIAGLGLTGQVWVNGGFL